MDWVRSAMKALRQFLFALFALGLVAEARAGGPPNVLYDLAKPSVLPAHRNIIKNYWKQIPAGSQLEEGVMTALTLGGRNGPEHVSGIIEVFYQTSQQQFERLARLKHAGNLDQQVAALGSRTWNRVVGVNAELRFADERIGAANVKSFQAPPGDDTIPDILDNAGNLYEIKYRTWSNGMPQNVIRERFAEILRQAEIQQALAASQGKMFTLVLEQPIPPSHLDLFEGMFYDLMNKGNVAIIDGF